VVEADAESVKRVQGRDGTHGCREGLFDGSHDVFASLLVETLEDIEEELHLTSSAVSISELSAFSRITSNETE